MRALTDDTAGMGYEVVDGLEEAYRYNNGKWAMLPDGYYYTSYGNRICHRCASVADECEFIVDVVTNWEDTNLQCDICNRPMPCVYGDD